MGYNYNCMKHDYLQEAILCNIDDAIYVVDRNLKIIYANPAAEELTGYSSAEALGKKCFDIFCEKSYRCDSICPPQKAMKEIAPILHKDAETRTTKGELKQTQISISPLCSSGACTGGIIVIKDITQIKQIEEKQHLLAEIVSHMAEGVLLTRVGDGVIVYTNSKCERMFGYNPGELVGKHISTVNAPTDRSPEETATDVMRALNENEVWSGEAKNIMKDGTTFWSYAVVSTFEYQAHGKVWISIHQDITERKKTEESLRESEEKYRQVVASTTDAIVVFDSDTGQFTEVNKAAEKLYGYSREEFLLMRHVDVSAEAEATTESVLRTVNENHSHIPLRYHRKKDGTVFPVEISAGLFSAGGKKLLCGVVRDITERKKTEEERFQKQEMFRIDAERQALKAQLRMLQAQIEPHFLFNTLANSISLIDKEPDNAKKMLRDLSELLRISLKRSRKEIATLADEADLLRNYLAIYRLRMGPRLHFEIAIPEELLALPFPPMLVQPLVENAVRHGIEPKVDGGVITITASRKEDFLRVSVTDTGGGFSAQGGGGGVGLANVRERLIALYGTRGRLILREKGDCGIEAIVEVPA